MRIREFPVFPESFWNLLSLVTTFKRDTMGLYLIFLLAAAIELFGFVYSFMMLLSSLLLLLIPLDIKDR